MRSSRQYKLNPSKLVNWYDNKCSPILPTDLIITQSSFLDTPCSACMQAFMHGEQEDLLHNFNAELIFYLMWHDSRVDDQFLHFIRGTPHAIESDGICPDILGKIALCCLRIKIPCND